MMQSPHVRDVKRMGAVQVDTQDASTQGTLEGYDVLACYAAETVRAAAFHDL